MGTILYSSYHIVISAKVYKDRIEDTHNSYLQSMSWPSVMITSFSKFWDIMCVSVWAKKSDAWGPFQKAGLVKTFC